MNRKLVVHFAKYRLGIYFYLIQLSLWKLEHSIFLSCVNNLNSLYASAAFLIPIIKVILGLPFLFLPNTFALFTLLDFGSLSFCILQTSTSELSRYYSFVYGFYFGFILYSSHESHFHIVFICDLCIFVNVHLAVLDNIFFIHWWKLNKEHQEGCERAI